METTEMFEKIMERLDAISAENTELISKVDAIQAKLEEMARGQLVSIIEQGERFMRELERSNTTVEAAIHAEALRDTVKIDKDELKEMLDSAFGSNEEVKAFVKKELDELAEAIGKSFNNVGDNFEIIGNNFKTINNNMDNGFRTTLQNGLTHFATLKELILNTDKRVADMSYTVQALPQDRGLI